MGTEKHAPCFCTLVDLLFLRIDDNLACSLRHEGVKCLLPVGHVELVGDHEARIHLFEQVFRPLGNIAL